MLTIEIDGENVAGDGLTLQPPPSNTSGSPGTSTIQGLAINGFGGNGITMSSYSGDTIAGNFIGTDVSGLLALGNGGNGIYVEDVDDFTIGGSTNDAANLISGNGENGIYVDDEGITGQIEGNLVGGGRSIAPALPNAEAAVDIEPDSDATTSAVQPDATGVPGYVYVTGGFTYLLYGLKLKYFKATSGTSIGAAILKGFAEPAPFSSRRSASISSLASPATPGPAIDLEDGANPLTNAPVLTAALTAASTTITGTLSSQPSDTYLVQFYSNTQLLPAGYGPGEQYIGSVNVPTSAAGNGSFTFQAPTAIPVGQFITATATLLDSSGNPLETSEFSAGVSVEHGTVLSPPAVQSVSTTKLIKHRVNQGTSTINIVFNEAMAPLAGSSGFYSLETPTKVRVHGKLKTKLIPVRFTAAPAEPTA